MLPHSSAKRRLSRRIRLRRQRHIEAGTTGAAQQQLVPDVRSAVECVLPSLACAATFVATSHVLYNAPRAQTSLSVSTDYYKARQGVAETVMKNLSHCQYLSTLTL